MMQTMTQVVAPFTVVIDSREQRMFHFGTLRTDAVAKNRPLIVPMVRGTLSTGDYSIEGMEAIIAIERKNPADLFQCCGKERRRFQDELKRFQHGAYQFAAVVCEADWNSLFIAPPNFTKLAPKIVYRSVLTWMIRYPKVHWCFCPSRDFAEKTTYRLLEKFWKEKQKS